MHVASRGKQEAQLSQRDRTTLSVIEYFAKSLKVTRNDTVKYGVHIYVSLYYYSIEIMSASRTAYIQRQRKA